jgi:Leucine-rich repeat (LRR) protein
MQALCEELGHGCLPRLRSLDLTGNKFGSVGSAALATALGRGALLQLEILNLGRNNIGDQGLLALSPPLSRLLALKELRLHSNQIGHEGVQVLLTHLGKAQLKLLKLNLSDNRINDAGCAAIIGAIVDQHASAVRLPPLAKLAL